MDASMKYWKYFMLILPFYCTGCQLPSAPDDSEENPVIASADRELEDQVPPIPLDSLVEANDPQRLDLSQNQLFLDTTHSSTFFHQLQSWSPRIYHMEAIAGYQKRLKQKYSPPPLRWSKFPTDFVRLRRSGSTFVLYKPCKGITSRYAIQDGLFLPYTSSGVMPKAIGRIKKIQSRGVILTLWEDIWDDNSHSSTLTILQSPESFVYELTYENEGSIQKEWITPKAHIDEFDLIVNHCPVIQVPEYEGF